jgi:hypothetical protein
VLSLQIFRLLRSRSISLGGWWRRIRRGAIRPARAAWSVPRLLAAPRSNRKSLVSGLHVVMGYLRKSLKPPSLAHHLTQAG